MEIFQNEVVFILLSSVLIGLTQLSKKYNIGTKCVVVALGIVLGSLYFLFETFFSEGTQNFITSSIVSIVGYATVIYNAYKILSPKQ